MKTQIKRYGGSTVIILSPEFLKFHDLKVGDWLDLSEVIRYIKNNTIQLKKEVKNETIFS